MNKYEFRSIGIGDIPVMADLLISRQNLENRVFPFLNNNCLNTKYITDMLEKLLNNGIKIDKVMIIGISAAGRTALHFSINYPNRVKKLILESAVICEAWPDFRTRIGALCSR